MTLVFKKSSSPAAGKIGQVFAEIVPGSSLEAAKAYLNNGIVPLPVPIGQSHPSIKWSQLTVTGDNLPILFETDCNISIKTSGESGGVVDVDIDHQAARLLAPGILPETDCVCGRLPPHDSHYLYRTSTPVQSRKFSITDGPKSGVIVELRGEGHLTIAPPSIHPKGGIVRFAPGRAGVPAVVDGEHLQRCVLLLAMATTIYETWPSKPGFRQDLALAFAGALT